MFKNSLKVLVILFVAIFGSQNVFAQIKGNPQKQKKEKEVVKTQPDSASTALAKGKPCQCPTTTINNYYGGGDEGGSYSTFRSNPYIAYGYRNYNYNHNYNYYSRRNFPRVYNYGNYRQYRSSGGNFRSNSYRGRNRGR